MKTTLEVCVDTPEDLNRAISARVDRIELCSALDLGGLTPTPGLIELAKDSPVPIFAMIRPRAGGFVYSEIELQTMEIEIATIREAGLAGVVFGALNPEAGLDDAALKRLIGKSVGLGMTFHRAIDETRSPSKEVQKVKSFGFERILTSGGADKAINGISELKQMILNADGQIEIMAGSGLNADCAAPLFEAGIRSFHGSFSTRKPGDDQRSVAIERIEAFKDSLERVLNSANRT